MVVKDEYDSLVLVLGLDLSLQISHVTQEELALCCREYLKMTIVFYSITYSSVQGKTYI